MKKSRITQQIEKAKKDAFEEAVEAFEKPSKKKSDGSSDLRYWYENDIFIYYPWKLIKYAEFIEEKRKDFVSKYRSWTHGRKEHGSDFRIISINETELIHPKHFLSFCFVTQTKNNRVPYFKFIQPPPVKAVSFYESNLSEYPYEILDNFFFNISLLGSSVKKVDLRNMKKGNKFSEYLIGLVPFSHPQFGVIYDKDRLKKWLIDCALLFKNKFEEIDFKYERKSRMAFEKQIESVEKSLIELVKNKGYSKKRLKFNEKEIARFDEINIMMVLIYLDLVEKKIKISDISFGEEGDGSYHYIINTSRLISEKGEMDTMSKGSKKDKIGTWSDITLKFLNQESLSISISGKCIKKKVGYEEMGFKKGSSKKISKPTEQWWLLLKLAKLGSHPIKGATKEKNKLHHQKGELKKKLQKYFWDLGLKDKSDPFYEPVKFGTSATKADEIFGDSTRQDHRDGGDYSLKMNLIPPVDELGGICIEE